MTDVRYIGTLGSYATREADGIVDELMRMMFFLETQGIHNERLHSFQIWQFAVADGLHIRDIGEASDAETEYRHLAMHHLNGHYPQVAHA